MKKILITGKDSYIGMSVERWLNKFHGNYKIDTVSTMNKEWENKDFSSYDVVFDVAGIAHKKIRPNMEDLFYKINRDMTIAICNKAKEEGVSQFIFLSSMNVFGDTSQMITSNMQPNPKNFYGNSKLQADQAIQKMNSDSFSVVSIRPPVVYGKGCKGNYPKLAKLIKVLPIFPRFNNTRSMIYIDNLCELIRLIIDNNERGIFHPQNRDYTSTVELAKEIAKVHNKCIFTTTLFNLIIRLILFRVRLVNRMFADDYYDKELSNYKEYEYCVTDFKCSIQNSEI